jgi:hypothetical protein
MSNSIRLTNKEIDALRQSFVQYFGPGDGLWLFGSRIDPDAKGGDIDLYIEAHNQDSEQAFMKKIKFLVSAKDLIGEQKIDVVLKLDDYDELPIYEIAKKTGVQLA